MGASSLITAAHKGARLGREGGAAILSLAQSGQFAHQPSRMADVTEHETHDGKGSVYRVAGALTITRAATTQREIDALHDPLTIDLTDIDRMDTVGAWLVYRAVRIAAPRSSAPAATRSVWSSRSASSIIRSVSPRLKSTIS